MVLGSFKMRHERERFLSVHTLLPVGHKKPYEHIAGCRPFPSQEERAQNKIYLARTLILNFPASEL